MANPSYISKFTLPTGTTYFLKDSIGRDYITAIMNKTFGGAYAANTAYNTGDYFYYATEDNGTVVLTAYRVTADISAASNTDIEAIASSITSITESDELKRLEAKIDAINNFTYVISKTAADTPYGVDNYYTGSAVTGTLQASAQTMYKIYLVKLQSTLQSNDISAEYVTILDGTTYSWEKIGTTENTFDYDTVEVVSNVTLSPADDNVLGSSTTFTNSTSSVSFAGGTDDSVLGADTVFSSTQPSFTPTNGTIANSDIFNNNEFVSQTEYSVSGETLTISESSTIKVPTVKTFSKTFATGGSVSTPTITAGDGDLVTAVTGIGTGTAAAQTITVGTNDRVDALTSVTPSLTKVEVIKEKSNS